MRAVAFSSLAAVAALASSPALARQPGGTASAASRTTVYDAAFFAQFAPRTAFDIVERVPGFQLDLGSTQSATGVGLKAMQNEKCKMKKSK